MRRRLLLLLMALLILAVKRTTALGPDAAPQAIVSAELGAGAASKNCYTCTGTGNTNNLCLTAPEKVTTGAAYLPCKRKYCTIVRREYTENPGVVVEITRGCEVKLPFSGKQVTDEFTTYFWTCTSNLCNTGDGTHPPAGGGGGGNDDLGYVLVEGENGATSARACALVTVGLLATAIRLW